MIAGDIPTGEDEPASHTVEKFGLGTIGPSADDGSGSRTTIRICIEISHSEADQLKDAVNLFGLVTERPTFVLAAQNFRELERRHEFYAQLWGLGRDGGQMDPRKAAVQLTGELVNWLTAVRLYLDHAATSLARRFGRESQQMVRFKEATVAEFNGSFAYRFMYKLRNYAQHCGLPLGGIDIRAAGSNDNRQWKQLITFYLARDRLLADYDGWGPVRKGLVDLEPHIDLMPLVREAWTAFERVEDELFDIDVREAIAHWPLVRNAVERCGADPELSTAPNLFRFTLSSDNDISSLSPLLLPNDVALLDRVAASSDPASVLRSGQPNAAPAAAPSRTASQIAIDTRGVQILSAFVSEGGATPLFNAIVNTVIKEDGGIDRLLPGLVNVAVVSLHMVAAAIGASPETILSGYLGPVNESSAAGGET